MLAHRQKPHLGYPRVHTYYRTLYAADVVVSRGSWASIKSSFTQYAHLLTFVHTAHRGTQNSARKDIILSPKILDSHLVHFGNRHLMTIVLINSIQSILQWCDVISDALSDSSIKDVELPMVYLSLACLSVMNVCSHICTSDLCVQHQSQ